MSGQFLIPEGAQGHSGELPRCDLCDEPIWHGQEFIYRGKPYHDRCEKQMKRGEDQVADRHHLQLFSMAERSGDPAIDGLIELFYTHEVPEPGKGFWQEFGGDHEWEGKDEGWWPTVEHMQYGDLSGGLCVQVAQDFVAFARESGFKAWVSPGQTSPEDFNFADRPERGSTAHTWAYIQSHDGTIYGVDFTASQYGYIEHPMVQRLENPEVWKGLGKPADPDDSRYFDQPHPQESWQREWTAATEDEDEWVTIRGGDEVLRGKPMDNGLFQWVPEPQEYDVNTAMQEAANEGYRWGFHKHPSEPDSWILQHKKEPGAQHTVTTRDLQLKGYGIYWSDPTLPRATADPRHYQMEPRYHLVDVQGREMAGKDPFQMIWHTERMDDQPGWEEPEPGVRNEEHARKNMPELWKKHWGSNDQNQFERFFNDAAQGMHAPAQDLLPEHGPQWHEHHQFYQDYKAHSGEMSRHMDTSIPQYAANMANKGHAILQAFPGQKVLDIAGGEGSFGKALAAQGMEAHTLDPNPITRAHHDANPVPGSTVIPMAFGEGGFETQAGDWVAPHGPTPEYDVVHEAMGLQFMGPNRDQQVEHAKRYLKPNGILIVDEKVSPGATPYDQAMWQYHEGMKDAWKGNYYSPDQLGMKNQQIGFQPGAKTAGMMENLVSKDELERVLQKHFRFVTHYWSAGNFKGYLASDSQETISRFLQHYKQHEHGHEAESVPRHLPPQGGYQEDFSPATLSRVKRSNVADLIATTLTNGGGTFQQDLSPAKFMSGYLVSLKGYGAEVPLQDFTAQEVQQWVTDLPLQVGDLIGTWVDEGKVYLDVTRHYDDLNQAMEVGRQQEQLAIYDAGTDSVIDLRSGQSPA